MVKVISCVITGNELCSDAFEDLSSTLEEVPEGVYVCQSNMIVEGEISVYAAGAFDGKEEEEEISDACEFRK